MYLLFSSTLHTKKIIENKWIKINENVKYIIIKYFVIYFLQDLKLHEIPVS